MYVRTYLRNRNRSRYRYRYRTYVRRVYSTYIPTYITGNVVAAPAAPAAAAERRRQGRNTLPMICMPCEYELGCC